MHGESTFDYSHCVSGKEKKKRKQREVGKLGFEGGVAQASDLENFGPQFTLNLNSIIFNPLEL